MLINGEWQTDTPTFPVFNPATGEEIGQVANGTEQDAARAIEAASAALMRRVWRCPHGRTRRPMRG